MYIYFINIGMRGRSFQQQITHLQIIRDRETGASLNYAFIEFNDEKGAVDAYYKMNNVLIDDRRIKVDFSQSVAKLWNKRRRGEVMTAYTGNGGGNGNLRSGRSSAPSK